MSTWNTSEVVLLERLRPVCTSREILEVFQELGFERTLDAIGRRARRHSIIHEEIGIPSYDDLTKLEIAAVRNMLAKRHTATPPMPVSPSQKGKVTQAINKDLSSLLVDMERERKLIPRTSSIVTRKISSDKESLVVVLSDFHTGKVTRDETGTVTYNTDIALQRIEETPQRVCESLTNDHYNNIDELVILFVGDMIDGEGIYPSQEVHIDRAAIEQTRGVVRSLVKMIHSFRDLFPFVRIVTTRGNHGRTGQSVESNWDNVIYQQLELILDIYGDTSIAIKNQYGNYNTTMIKGWKGLIRHYAPAQADTAAGRSKFAGWYGMHEWDFLCYGHFHHWGIMTWNSLPIFRNGSLIGGDGYAESLAVHDNPCQLIFGVTENKLPTFITPIQYL